MAFLQPSRQPTVNEVTTPCRPLLEAASAAATASDAADRAATAAQVSADQTALCKRYYKAMMARAQAMPVQTPQLADRMEMVQQTTDISVISTDILKITDSAEAQWILRFVAVDDFQVPHKRELIAYLRNKILEQPETTPPHRHLAYIQAQQAIEASDIYDDGPDAATFYQEPPLHQIDAEMNRQAAYFYLRDQRRSKWLRAQRQN